MRIVQLIQESLESWFGEEHLSALRHRYFDLVAKGEFDIEEREYNTGKAVLSEQLTADQKNMLEELECAYSFCTPIAAKYGFFCGLFVGFHHYFIDNKDWKYGLENTLFKNLFERPGMDRLLEYSEQNKRCLELTTQLEDLLPKELYEHVTSIDCAWGQRIHFASTQEFYMGYRFALMVIDQIIPMDSNRLLADRLRLEYDLGMIEDVDRLERWAERRKDSST